ncbi:hypothetical protein PF010_g23516 [Phytophthora fragariae]|uniref:Uncharacterized protein n=1 Tax=Phytophthora fragariae TaxID=53985 RepID=A0A6G0K5R3_9STRA|nr:hypothetical protein PF010_g23516 [Phytophthora fragariae]
MVAPTPKAPRHTLSEKERLPCREALLSERHERRIRRAGHKDRTALRTITAEAKDTAAQVASDVNETADDEAVEIPTTSQQKTTGKQTVGDSPSSQPRSSHVLEDAEAVINGMLVTIEGDKAAATPNQVSVAHGKTGSSKRKRRSQMKGTVSVAVAFCMKMRLKPSPLDGAAAEAQAEPTPTPDCVIDGDPNLMEGGAEECTGLNSDENLELCEDPEDQGEDRTDSWVGDWDIGAITDEDPKEEHDELPDTL